jgi:hypothetical protein
VRVNKAGEKVAAFSAHICGDREIREISHGYYARTDHPHIAHADGIVKHIDDSRTSNGNIERANATN